MEKGIDDNLVLYAKIMIFILLTVLKFCDILETDIASGGGSFVQCWR